MRDEPAAGLSGKRILIVEDEYFVAEELRRDLLDAGAVVLGPAGTVKQAIDIIASGCPLDAAVLDVNLEINRDAYPVAEALRARGVPFVFATGYDAGHIRKDFAEVPLVCKPFGQQAIEAALLRSLARGS